MLRVPSVRVLIIVWDHLTARRGRQYGLPNDVTPPSSPSLLLPADFLFFAAI
jgi:hypothetical protein